MAMGGRMGQVALTGACLLLRSASAKFTNEGSMSTEQMYGTVLKIPLQAVLLCRLSYFRIHLYQLERESSLLIEQNTQQQRATCV